jgi:hypothetical protein
VSVRQLSAPRPFDLERFKKACETDGLDPADVVAHAALGKSIDELTQDDRPLLLASLKEMSATSGSPFGQRRSGRYRGGLPSI